MASNRTRRIAKEIADIKSDIHSNVTVEPVRDDDLTHLRGIFNGPPDTPYEGGTYSVDIRIPSEYPFRPPMMKFETKLWHPNVSSQTVRSGNTLVQVITLAHSIPTGRNLPRHFILSVVTGPHHQIRPHLLTIAPLHSRTEGPTRRRSCGYADPQSRRVRACGT